MKSQALDGQRWPLSVCLREGGQVRRWEKGGTGRHVDIEAANHTFMQGVPLKNGGMLFATADPAFGILRNPDAQGRAQTLQGPGQLVFWGTPGSLRVSSNSQIVEKGTNLPRHTIRFALAERRLDVDPPADKTLTAPLMKAPGLKLTGWQDGYHPAVDGRPLVLDSYAVLSKLSNIVRKRRLYSRNGSGRSSASTPTGS